MNYDENQPATVSATFEGANSQDALPLVDTLPLATNLEPRCPVTLLMDISLSTSGEPIRKINAGIQAMLDYVRQDAIAANRCDLSLITFGGEVTVECQGARVDQVQPEEFYATGNTPMGQAINVALDICENRTHEFLQQGIPQYTPLCFLLTDGAPTDCIESAIKRVQQMEGANRLSFFPIGVDGADMQLLNRFSSKRSALRLDPDKFHEFFIWIGNTLTQVSRKNPGDGQLPLASIGWNAV